MQQFGAKLPQAADNPGCKRLSLKPLAFRTGSLDRRKPSSVPHRYQPPCGRRHALPMQLAILKPTALAFVPGVVRKLEAEGSAGASVSGMVEGLQCAAVRAPIPPFWFVGAASACSASSRSRFYLIGAGVTPLCRLVSACASVNASDAVDLRARRRPHDLCSNRLDAASKSARQDRGHAASCSASETANAGNDISRALALAS